MWGKVQFSRSRKSTLEDPTLVEDNGIFRSRHLASGVQNDPFGRQTLSKDLPALPPEPLVSTLSRPAYGDHRVTSSIYSHDEFDSPNRLSYGSVQQPRPERSASRQTTDHFPLHPNPEISPPDSPISLTDALERQGSSRVSPIEDENKPPVKDVPMGNKFTSQLPVLRKSGRVEGVSSQPDRPLSPQNTNNASSNHARVTKRDDFSGGPTTKHAGKAGQTSSKPAASQSSGLFGWGKEQFQPRRKAAETRNRAASSSLAAREPWKGLSGRSPIVNPVQEKPNNKLSARLHLSRNRDPVQEKPASSESSSVGLVGSVVTTITAGEPDGPRVESRPGSKLSVREGENLYARRSPDVPPRVDLPGTGLETSLAGMGLEEQPMSRFSATTTDAATDASSSTTSPRGSVVEGDTPTFENVPSIMSRRRPVPSAVAAVKTNRKPTPSEAEMSKALPQCPQENQAHSRIEALEARRDSLAQRKANINTIIHELTQVIQPSSVAYDMATRDEVKKTVASLNDELDEIKREEHEIGFKLVRAWKKRDEQDAYGGGSGLWVRRVTS